MPTWSHLCLFTWNSRMWNDDEAYIKWTRVTRDLVLPKAQVVQNLLYVSVHPFRMKQDAIGIYLKQQMPGKWEHETRNQFFANPHPTTWQSFLRYMAFMKLAFKHNKHTFFTDIKVTSTLTGAWHSPTIRALLACLAWRRKINLIST